ncbi:hypothetical protein ACQ4PT_045941 [Festuca glaucescens]
MANRGGALNPNRGRGHTGRAGRGNGGGRWNGGGGNFGSGRGNNFFEGSSSGTAGQGEETNRESDQHGGGFDGVFRAGYGNYEGDRARFNNGPGYNRGADRRTFGNQGNYTYRRINNGYNGRDARDSSNARANNNVTDVEGLTAEQNLLVKEAATAFAKQLAELSKQGDMEHDGQNGNNEHADMPDASNLGDKQDGNGGGTGNFSSNSVQGQNLSFSPIKFGVVGSETIVNGEILISVPKSPNVQFSAQIENFLNNDVCVKSLDSAFAAEEEKETQETAVLSHASPMLSAVADLSAVGPPGHGPAQPSMHGSQMVTSIGAAGDVATPSLALTPVGVRQLHFILLLLAYYFPTHIASNGGNGSTVKCLPDQALSLLQLKHSFHNQNLSSWKHGTDCCHWDGVSCDRASGQVITLDLSDRNLQSTSGLSPALLNLTSLTNLSLAGNDFCQASLPNFGFEQLTELTSVDLSGTNLNGQIPIGIAHLRKLKKLGFSYNNNMFFSEPSFQMVVGNLSNLRELYLDGVDISRDGKTWSSLLADSVPRLQYLSLSSCGISGHIHSSFSRLQSLKMINLSQNSISGKVPEFLADHSSLSILILFDNQFEGHFPTKIFQLKKLRVIELSLNNRLSGHLPNFPVENSLEFLDLTWTNFTVSIPTCFVNLRFLRFLGLSMVEVPSLRSLMLSGSGSEKQNFSWVANLEHLMDLELDYYNFSSSIPSWIANLTSLTSLGRHGCSLYGRIPTWIGNLSNLSSLNLADNYLQGKIPKNVFALPVLQEINLDSNQLSGSNKFSGTIMDTKGDYHISNHFPSLQILDLASNNFYGNLPKEWFNQLKAMMENVNEEGQVLGHVINPSGTFYQDTVTVTFKGFELIFTKILTSFKVIDFSNNSFDGPIPESIGKLVSLHGLNMSYNNFTGQIPRQFAKLTQLESLDLSWNQLSGEIPQALTSLTSLGWLNLSYNSLSGRVPQGNQFLTFFSSSFEGNMGLCGPPLSRPCDTSGSITPNAVSPPESNSLWEDKLSVILLFAFVGLGFGVGFALSFLI